MSWNFNPFTGNLDYYRFSDHGGMLEYHDDGTYINVFSEDRIVMKYVKATKQLIFSSGLDTDGGF